MKNGRTIRKGIVACFLGGVVAFGATGAMAEEQITMGLAGQSYWPTIVAKVAESEGFFERAGVKADITVHKSGAEAFESLAAGIVELALASPAGVGRAREKGVYTKIVAAGTEQYLGWYLMVTPDSPVQSIADLDGKKVGISSAGSGSDVLATWVETDAGITFEKIPVGGSGLVPNLLSGNIDAAMMYSPPSFELLEKAEARSLLRLSEVVPKNANTSWAASDTAIAENPKGIQLALDAFYGAVQMMQADRDKAIQLIVAHSDLSPSVAAREFDETIANVVPDGAVRAETVQQSIDLMRTVGVEVKTPIEEIVSADFSVKPVTN